MTAPEYTRAPTPEEAVRLRACPLCDSPPGTPCQARPAGDHLARYLGGLAPAGLSREYLSIMVVGELLILPRSAGGAS